MKGLLTLFMVVLMISSRGEGQSRILVVMPFASPSHKNILVPLMTTLASRGHQLTFITGKPTEELRENPNITEIVVDLKVEFSVEKEDKDAVSFFQSVVDEPFWTKIKFMEHFSNIPESIIESTLGDPQVKRILTDGAAQFDLVLISMVTEYVGTPFAWHFKCPFIFFSPNVIFSDLPFVLGDWEHPEYVPFMVTSFTDNMNWLERTINTFLVHFTAQVQKNWFSPQIDEVVRRFLPGYPSMVDVERNVSLVFTNTHPSFSYPRALPPNVVEIGAIHCHPAKPLPKVVFLTLLALCGQTNLRQVEMTCSSWTNSSRAPVIADSSFSVWDPLSKWYVRLLTTASNCVFLTSKGRSTIVINL